MPVEFGQLEETVKWANPRQMRGHVSDVVGLAWAKDSSFLASCSLDSTTILWHIDAKSNKFVKLQTFEGHKKYVQGVSIDPFMKYIASQSSDSTVRIYKNRKMKKETQFFHKTTIKSREEVI